MEQEGLRPDYIAGTSMGSIIAALYAMGYSADQMEEMILEVNWDQILANKVPLNYIAFEEKEYYDRYLVGIPINKKLRPELGSGMLHGQMLSEVLHHYFWPSYQYENFDEFPIPYRCVATDVNTGKAIVFHDGPLPTALRSSMAIPSVFTAVDFDTTLAVDGGTVNNFPTNIVREMGADYIIGVNVGATSSGEAVDDMGSIMMSLASIPSQESLPAHIAECDVYIQPDLALYSSSAFSKAEEILEYGRLQGQQYRTELAALAREMGMKREPLQLDTAFSPIVLDSISYEGNSLFSDVLIDKKLGIGNGDTVGRRQLEEAIRRVYGINGFDKVSHELSFDEEGHAELHLQMQERLPYQLYASVHADNIFSEGIVLNFTARDLLGRESRSIFALDISANPRFRFDYYKYLNVNKKFALNLRYDFAREQIPVYEEGLPDDVLINRINRVELNVMNTQSLVSSFSIGGFYENLRAQSRFDNIVPSAVKNSVEEYYGLRFSWMRNNLNDRNFATRGSETEIIIDNYLSSWGVLEYQEGVDSIPLSVGDQVIFFPTSVIDEVIAGTIPGYYAKFLFKQISFVPLNERLSLIPRATVGLTLSEADQGSAFDNFKSGGWQRVWRDDIRVLGLQYNELRTDNIGVAGIKLQHLFFENLFFRYGADLVAYNNHIPLSGLADDFDFNEIIDENLFLGYGAELTWRTILGPISGGLSFNTSDPYPRYYFALGFSFNYSD